MDTTFFKPLAAAKPDVLESLNLKNKFVIFSGARVLPFHPPDAFIARASRTPQTPPLHRSLFFKINASMISTPGGKLEMRKGQDIIIRAFRLFSQRVPEAVLVTAWHNPWYGCTLRCFGPLP